MRYGLPVSGGVESRHAAGARVIGDSREIGLLRGHGRPARSLNIDDAS